MTAIQFLDPKKCPKSSTWGSNTESHLSTGSTVKVYQDFSQRIEIFEIGDSYLHLQIIAPNLMEVSQTYT